MIDRWIEGRRLVPLHRGVYAVGHRRLRREGFWLAAVLAAGRGAVLSHRETHHEVITGFSKVDEIPFDFVRRMMSVVVRPLPTSPPRE